MNAKEPVMSDGTDQVDSANTTLSLSEVMLNACGWP